MKTPIVSFDEAICLLQNGGVGVMPTDTVYGLVARAADPEAVGRLYALKHRDHKPGTIIAAETEQLEKISVRQADLQKVAEWWPGPLSAILDIEHEYLHQGLGDVAMRVVADPTVRSILTQTGALMTTSANHPGQPGSVNVQEAINYFNDRVDFYVDGGNLAGCAPSTIIKITSGGVKIIRQGAVIINPNEDSGN